MTPAADYQQRQRTETEIVKEAVRHTVVAMLGIVTIEESGQTVTELVSPRWPTLLSVAAYLLTSGCRSLSGAEKVGSRSGCPM